MADDDYSKVITTEDGWDMRLHQRDYNDREWKAYQGFWTIYSGGSTETKMVEFHGIRCFRLAGDGGDEKLLHKNLLEVNLKHGNPVLRGDGFWESNYVYTPKDPTNCCDAQPQDSEAGLQPHQLRRLTPITPDAYLVIPPALPPAADATAAPGDEKTFQAGSAPAPSDKGESAMTPGVWGYEAFLKDGACRWSMGATYDLSTRRLQQTMLIREYIVPVDPEAEQQSTKLDVPDARPGVGDPAAAATLVGAKRFEGAEVRYRADDRKLRVAPSLTPEIIQTPELPDVKGNTLLRHPDGMYAHVPEVLPAAGSDSGNVTLTWGGPMR